MKNLNFKIEFNTLGGKTVLVWNLEQCMDSELKDVVSWIVKNREQGIVGGTFDNIPHMGKVTINLVT